VPDPWINLTRPGCCGPLGASGPIGSEFYLRNGVSLPVATGLKEFLQAGWMTSAGARSLFFNRATDAAWTVDIGTSFTYNNSSKSDDIFALQIPFLVTRTDPNTNLPVTRAEIGNVPVAVRDYQRWSLNVALGREWYLLNPAYTPGRHLRFGIDSGGRWGASKLEFDDFAHLPTIDFRKQYDVYGAYFISLHTDLDFPICSWAWFVFGVRAEWNYNWSDVLRNSLPAKGSDLQDVNLMFTTGFRY
jgi:hypothetical protein